MRSLGTEGTPTLPLPTGVQCHRRIELLRLFVVASHRPSKESQSLREDWAEFLPPLSRHRAELALDVTRTAVIEVNLEQPLAN
jgi:hypothetical protein